MPKQIRHRRSATLQHIWILDSSPSDSSFLEKSIGAHYHLRFFPHFEEFRAALNQPREGSTVAHPGLILAETELPDGKLVDFLREDGAQSLPLMVVSHAQSFQTIAGCLELGARDYFIKPIHPDLLRAKIGCFFSRHNSQRDHALKGLRLDPFGLQVRNAADVTVSLTVKQYQILSLLYLAYPNGVARKEIQETIWKRVSVGSKTFDVHLFSLRRKLESLGYEIQFNSAASYHLIRRK